MMCHIQHPRVICDYVDWSSWFVPLTFARHENSQRSVTRRHPEQRVGALQNRAAARQKNSPQGCSHALTRPPARNRESLERNHRNAFYICAAFQLAWSRSERRDGENNTRECMHWRPCLLGSEMRLLWAHDRWWNENRAGRRGQGPPTPPGSAAAAAAHTLRQFRSPRLNCIVCRRV